MSSSKIEKRTDPAVRHLRKVRDGEDADRVFCEGFRLVEELFKSGWSATEVYVTTTNLDRARNLLLRYKKTETPVRLVSDDVMAFVSGVESAPGLIAIARTRRLPALPSASPLVLVLHGLQLPQNVGAIARSAEAAGVTEIWITRATANPFNPKALRGSSGSLFRLPVMSAASLAEVADQLKTRGIRLLAASQTGKRDYDRVDWTAGSALVMGSEGAGFTPADLALLDETVKIPMSGSVESLNVGSAAAVCLFEAARQRRAAVGGGKAR